MFGVNTDFAAALREREQKESSGKAGREARDKEFLPYYNLDFKNANASTMRIRLLPTFDGSMNLWETYHIHKVPKGVTGVKSIHCSYTSSGQSCPICQHGYAAHQRGDKEEAKRWRKDQRWIGQAVVVQSPIEIPASDTGNPIKKVYLPSGVVEVVKEALLNGQVQNPMACDFVIKQTENKGGFAAYEKSFFDFQTMNSDFPPHVVQQLSVPTAKLHDVRNDVPAATTTAECQEWLDKCRAALASTAGQSANNAPAAQAQAPAGYAGGAASAPSAYQAPANAPAPSSYAPAPSSYAPAPSSYAPPPAPSQPQPAQTGSLLDQLRRRDAEGQ